MLGETSSVTCLTQVHKACRWPVRASWENGPVTSDYRLSPLLAARMLGAVLALLGLLVFLATAVVVLVSAPVLVLSVAVVACVVGVFAAGWFLRRTYVVRLDEVGYHVRFVRGAGVKRASWTDVEDALTTTVAGAPCVVLRLRDGRSTTIPVGVLEGDPDDLCNRSASTSIGAVRTPGDPRFRGPAPGRVTCLRASLEASPSQVYGARLLSGFGV